MEHQRSERVASELKRREVHKDGEGAKGKGRGGKWRPEKGPLLQPRGRAVRDAPEQRQYQYKNEDMIVGNK
eukprot:3019818-Pyramimonas_sp.AAC.1